MRSAALASACTATLAVLGFYAGASAHGACPLSLVPALAGAAGGFALGCVSCHLLERRAAGGGSGKLVA